MIEKVLQHLQAGGTDLNQRVVPLKSFELLCAFLKSKDIRWTNHTVQMEEGELVLQGTAITGLFILTQSEFCLFPEEETEGEFGIEWTGNLDRLRLSELDLPTWSLVLAILPESLREIEFTNLYFSYSSTDETIEIECSLSDQSVTFEAAHVSLYHLGASLIWNLAEHELEAGILSAELTIGDTPILVHLDLPSGDPSVPEIWRLSLGQEATLSQGIQDVAAYLSTFELLAPIVGNGKLSEALPQGFLDFEGLSISEFSLRFNPRAGAVYSFRTTLNYHANWSPFEGFKLSDIGLQVFATFHSSYAAVTLRIFGSFFFVDSWYTNFSFQLPLNQQEDWVIELDGYADLEEIQQLEMLNLFKIDALNLPPEWLQIRDIRLQELKVVFNPLARKIKQVNLSVEMRAESTLIPGITVRDPALELTLTFDN